MSGRPPRALLRPASAVRLWLFPLTLRDGDAALLSRDETDRAARLRFTRDQDRFIAGRARLRHILGHAVGRDPAALQFQYGASGKPTLPGGPHFNLSHTGDLAALALADFELGIDIERVRPIEPDVARRFFAADEVAALGALPASQHQTGFYACWTRKEAYLKARGDGLMLPLDSFSVSLGRPARLLRADDDEPDAWSLHPFLPAAGVLGAIAARQQGLRVTLETASFPAAPG